MAHYQHYLLLLGMLLLTPVSASYGSETAGYVEVRPGAHMFWLLQYSTHPDGYLNRPWIIWIQGGPGVSGSGYGNYMMFGPEDLEGDERLVTWLQSASIIYVDNPVGTGFSYLSNDTAAELSLEDISRDLVSFTHQFLQQHEEFQTMPMYIFGQSYGGKMGPAFAYYLEQARQKGDIKCDLVGLGIGNGAVSELDIRACYTDMLYEMSLIDDHKRDILRGYIDEMWLAMEENDMDKLDELEMDRVQVEIEVSNYNLIQDPVTAVSMYDIGILIDLETKMEEEFRKKFDFIPEHVTWNGINWDLNIETNIINRFRSVYHLIDHLLFNSSIQIIVYSGQYDVICCTSAQLAWIRHLEWPGAKEFYAKERETIFAPDSGETEMYVKVADRLKFYWVMRSGHVVPRDVPEVALRMLNRVFENTDI